jgi:hypothetical protein
LAFFRGWAFFRGFTLPRLKQTIRFVPSGQHFRPSLVVVGFAVSWGLGWALVAAARLMALCDATTPIPPAAPAAPSALPSPEPLLP